MGTLIGGALVSIQVDLGETPFILDRDLLDLESSVLTPTTEAMSDLTCQVLSGNWVWGAPSANGILTDVVTGRAEIALADPNRTLDPLNEESPVIGRIGNPARILIDGTPAFTGVVVNIIHEAGEGVSTLELADNLSLLHQQSVSVAWTRAPTSSQFTQLMTALGWDPELLVLYGATVTKRLADPFVGTAFEALTRLRDAELGDLWADHQGRISFRSRGQPRPDTPKGIIGCGGIAMASLAAESKRIAIINHVLIDMDPGADRQRQDAASVSLHQRRSFRSSEAELLFDNL